LIVAEAVARGHDVTALARGESGVLPEGAAFVRADRTAPGAFDAVTGDWDAVIDVTRQPGQLRAAVNALAPRAAHWVFVSSCSAYRDATIVGGDESMPLHEPLDHDVMADMSEYGAAKAACEKLLLDAVGPERAHIARVSLIGGPGDWSGRGVYWPWRFAHPSNPEGRVLVPAVDGLVQLIDARDLAAWTVDAAERRVAGIANVGGETLPLAEHLRIAREVAGVPTDLVAAGEEWLTAHDVQPWMGPRSLPLWLPADSAGLNSSDTSLAASLGLRRRALAETLADTLDWRERHPEIALKAGLTDAEERELLAAV
jgi:nucleoside-diphosphate-sugar epimerase